MDIKEIQKIIDEQRKISPIHKKSERVINSTIAASSRIKDERAMQNLRDGVKNRRNNTYQKENNSRPEVRQKLSESQKKHKKTPEHLAKVAASNKAKPSDPKYKSALLAGLAKRDRPYLAGEYGAFPNRSAAGRYLKENNLMTNAIKKLENVLTTETGPYRYITHEEYELILELEKRRNKI